MLVYSPRFFVQTPPPVLNHGHGIKCRDRQIFEGIHNGCFALYQGSLACLGNTNCNIFTAYSDSDMDSLWWAEQKSRLVLRRQRLACQEEFVWKC